MTRHRYSLAIGCYLAIPAVMIAGAGLARLIDPEMALGHANYERDFRWLELARQGVLTASSGLMLVLWAATCYLVLASRQRSPLWVVLGAAGPFGFMFIAMLGDRSPAPRDPYQGFIQGLRIYWRIPLEIGLFVSAWCLAYGAVVLLRELMIAYASFSTGRPAADIVAEQLASSGMWAFGEALETMYLFPLVYLLWPVVFNFAGRRFMSGNASIQRCELPQAALLGRYRQAGAYTDCYTTRVERRVSHAEYVEAFYTTPLFKVERLLLAWFVSRPSTDAEAGRLATGELDTFAAWSVEARGESQLLLCDFSGRTRSWLMVAAEEGGGATGVLLYFGSAVVPVARGRFGMKSMGLAFGLLLGFHKLYSRALLFSARSRLARKKP